MKCANCGRAIPDHSSYCAYCGTQMPVGPADSSSGRRLLGVVVAVAVLVISGVALVLALRPMNTSIPSSKPAVTRNPTRPTPPPTRIPSPRISPTPNLTAEIDAALREYVRVRKEAEETLNPELLRQVCVDPYLSWKIARIQENIRDRTHWETPSSSFTITSLSTPSVDQAYVRVRKTETKLFFPRGSSVPDDEICKGTFYSYRNCTYEAEYTMVYRSGHWYVSDAKSVTDCQPRCQH